MLKKVNGINLNIHFRCPCCHGSQYRTSIFDVSEKNPYGAKCIFCKSTMTFADRPDSQTKIFAPS
ncbi:cold-shock protein [Enterobacter ludwigii]|uniref:cold shock small protein YmcF n=1 Tax=Enterobacter ludwigii TaxID=299767 RepID=UPI003B21A517